MSDNNLFGKALWNALEPKILSEHKVSSVKLCLVGVVDRVEVYNDKAIPFEIKSGRAPSEGVWSNHKLQLAAYSLILRDKFEVSNHGYIDYIGNNRRKVVFNEFLESELRDKIRGAKTLLKSIRVPPHVENKRKCDVCNLHDMCYDKVFMKKAGSEKNLKV
ncbi:CRISPR-associated protein Cas4 [Candidatus Woesearchaeota archaeon]|nr:CRISPR-associated protein Cas4 [Candidatus Woesearchaeota archaeon]